MSITIEIPDDYFTEDEKDKLKDLFQTEEDDRFSEAIQNVVYAALSEYKEMFLGMGLPSRADEIQQHRLFYLIKYYFIDSLPSEAQVSSMFQLTQSRSKSLIRFVMTRFHYDLEQVVKDTLKKTVEKAALDDENEEYHVVIQSDNILEELNRIIGMNAPNYDPVKKVKNMSRTYSISKDSHNALKEALDL